MKTNRSLVPSCLGLLLALLVWVMLAQVGSSRDEVAPWRRAAGDSLPLIMAAAAEKPVQKASYIRTKAWFEVPAGWREYEERILAEPVLSFSQGRFTISIYLFGGPDSRHESPEAFLNSFEARDDRGRPARLLENILIAGRNLPLYCRVFSIGGWDRPDHLTRTPKRTFREQFVVLPATSYSFFVLKYTVPEEPPAADKPPDAAWRLFLQSFQLRSGLEPEIMEPKDKKRQIKDFPPEIWEKSKDIEKGEGLPPEIKEYIEQRFKKRDQ